MKNIAILTAALSFVVAQPAAAQAWDKEQSEVWTAVASAWDTHIEANTWSEVLDPKGYGWNGPYPVPTSKAEMKSRSDVFGAEGKILHYQLNPVKISVQGDTAIAYYHANITETNYADKRENSIERCADTLIKRNSKWHFLGWLCETKTETAD